MLDILIKYLQALFFAFLVSHHQKQTIHGQIPQAGGALVIPLWLAPAVSRPALRRFCLIVYYAFFTAFVRHDSRRVFCRS